MKLYDTTAGKIRYFEPRNRDEVTMYVCGPTVYDVPHIGNARTAVVFDLLFRILRRIYSEGHVVYARNFTDIDDKIIARANELGIPIGDLTIRTVQQYEDAMKALGVIQPTVMPRATMTVRTMAAMIESLLGAGFAYASEGHVLFDVTAYAKHQLFASEKMTLLVPNNNGLEAGARIEIASYKRSPEDFVLWKPSKEGEPSYEGPRGLPGRPGWHIECSAMIDAVFHAETIDIHGGGNDLKFPHHQCEVMQTEALGTKLANYWVHSGMLTVDGQKMSKSLGNFTTVPEVLRRVNGEVLRYFFLTGHYRQPLDFTWEKLDECKRALDRLYRALQKVWEAGTSQYQMGHVESHLRNDLNTPEALASMHELATYIFKEDAHADGRAALLQCGQLLGILSMTPDEWFRQGSDVDVEAEIARRQKARDEKDFALADSVRVSLAEKGIVLEDRPEGTIWHRG